MPESSTSLLDFDPNRPQVLPKDAATVVVLRDADAGPEVFCVLRHARSGFLGGAVVFPGGKVDPTDALDSWDGLTTEPHPRAQQFAAEAIAARTLAITACREMLEEGAILPTSTAETGALDDQEVELIRAELRQGSHKLSESLRKRGVRLALDALVPWGRWVTPEAESRRFDARFFLLSLPAGQVGRHDEHETTMSFWATPQTVLDKFIRQEIFLAPPTTRTLELLTSAANVRAAMDIAEQQSLRPICPRFSMGDGADAPYLALPGDPSHDVRERRIGGSTRFVLRDGIFVSASEDFSARQEGQGAERSDKSIRIEE